MQLQSFYQDPCWRLDPKIEYFCPVRRYCTWNYFLPSHRDLLKNVLGYKPNEWNYELNHLNPIEEMAWVTLGSNEQNLLGEIGYEEKTYDCCVNHYESYSWEHIVNNESLSGVREAFTLLGYNESLWESNGPSPFENLMWDALPTEVQTGLYYHLCYSKELWDDINLKKWKKEVDLKIGKYYDRLPGMFPMTETPTMNPSGTLRAFSNVASSLNLESKTQEIYPSIQKTSQPQTFYVPFSSSISSPSPSFISTLVPSLALSVSPSKTNSFSFMTGRHQKNPSTQTSPMPSNLLSTYPSFPTPRPSEESSGTLSFLHNTKYSIDPLSTSNRNSSIEPKAIYNSVFSIVPSVVPTNSSPSKLTIIPAHPASQTKVYIVYPSEMPLIKQSNEPTSYKSSVILSSDGSNISSQGHPDFALQNTSSSSMNSYFLDKSLPTGYPTHESSNTSTFMDILNRTSWSEDDEIISTTIQFVDSESPNFELSDEVVSSWTTCRRLDRRIEYFCPYQRYCEWDFYDYNVRQYLEFQIGYTKNQWNYNQEVNDIERTAFVDLDETTKVGLSLFAGYDEDTHDCCLGHYESYDWSDFDRNKGYGSVLDALIAMGYDETIWQNSLPTKYEYYYWVDLPEEIQLSLFELCYTEETWNMVPLPLWSSDALLPGMYEKRSSIPSNIQLGTSMPTINMATITVPTQTPEEGVSCRKLDPHIISSCPPQRYCEWDYFDFDERQILRFQLGYTKELWNYKSINYIEESAFYDLQPFVQAGLIDFGFDAEMHDCCHNHYASYDWNELALNGMANTLAAYEALGYNEERWNNNEPTKYDLYDWVELPVDIKKLLIEDLCYNKELWDMTPLTEWPENIIFPGSIDTLGLITSGSVGMKMLSLLPLLCMGITILHLLF